VNDARRRRARRSLLWFSIPVAIAGLVLAAKLVGLQATAGAGIDSYERGSYASSAEQFEELLEWNAFEPWIAHFDRGTAMAATGDYIPAITDLEKAFATAPDSTRCDVAVNLSLSWELLGDSYAQQGELAGAARLYETARAVIAAAGEECQPPNAPPNTAEGRDAGEELERAGERLDTKSETAPPQPGEGEESDGESAERLERLRQQNEDAAREKAERQTQDRGENGGGGFTDRPW